jgi:quinolinate synthase
VKAETDICCTSANAVKVVESLPDNTVIFLPDAYLAKNVQLKTKKRLISWEKGKCMVHEQYKADDIVQYRAQFGKDLLVISHPECDTDVTAASDFAGSTSQMESFIRDNPRKNVLLITGVQYGRQPALHFPGQELSLHVPHLPSYEKDHSCKSARCSSVQTVCS